MILEGKKISVLGDSITEGVGTSAPEFRFCDIVARETGATVLNYGISGTRLAQQYKPTVDKPSFDLDFNMRAPEIDPESDIILVFGGTNDFGHGDAPFGAFGDATRLSFCGAVRELLETLIMQHPRAEIAFITPTHRLGEDVPNASNHKVLKDYVDIIRQTCEKYSLPVLDLYAMGRMQPAVPAIQEACMPDGLHPNDAGNRLIADRVIAFLKAL